jgi:hypothetical protein
MVAHGLHLTITSDHSAVMVPEPPSHIRTPANVAVNGARVDLDFLNGKHSPVADKWDHLKPGSKYLTTDPMCVTWYKAQAIYLAQQYADHLTEEMDWESCDTATPTPACEEPTPASDDEPCFMDVDTPEESAALQATSQSNWSNMFFETSTVANDNAAESSTVTPPTTTTETDPIADNNTVDLPSVPSPSTPAETDPVVDEAP